MTIAMIGIETGASRSSPRPSRIPSQGRCVYAPEYSLWTARSPEKIPFPDLIQKGEDGAHYDNGRPGMIPP